MTGSPGAEPVPLTRRENLRRENQGHEPTYPTGGGTASGLCGMTAVTAANVNDGR
jgi:hypothetical protein